MKEYKIKLSESEIDTLEFMLLKGTNQLFKEMKKKYGNDYFDTWMYREWNTANNIIQTKLKQNK